MKPAIRHNLSVYFVIVSVFLVLNLISFTTDKKLEYDYDSPVFAQTPNNLTLADLINQGSPYYGNLSAPIVIIDFSDFQCYLCKRYVDNTEQQINSSYVQTDKAIYVFKHLPNRGFDSKNASLAAQCTNDQGKFWEFDKILYANQGPIDSGWVSTENLNKFSSQLDNVDMTQFDTCFETKNYESFIDKDVALANSLGFTQTPSFIIMNSEGSIIKKIEGPKPFPIFKTVIEDLENENDSK